MKENISFIRSRVTDRAHRLANEVYQLAEQGTFKSEEDQVTKPDVEALESQMPSVFTYDHELANGVVGQALSDLYANPLRKYASRDSRT